MLIGPPKAVVQLDLHQWEKSAMVVNHCPPKCCDIKEDEKMKRVESTVIPGADSFYYEGGDIGILLIHGFVGTPQSIEDLGAELANRGFTVHAPRLTGHGTKSRDLELYGYDDWFNDVVTAYKQLKETCKQVYCLGQSMGGALALLLAKKYGELDGLILINTALTLPDYEYLRYYDEKHYIDEGSPDIKNPTIHEITYDHIPVKAVHSLQKVMSDAGKSLSQIHCPILCFKSIHDHVVPPENTDRIFIEIQTDHKWLRVLYNSYHVASMDYDQSKIIQDTTEFLNTINGEKRNTEWGGKEVG